MRDYDDSVGGPCEEDVATLRWLEDTAHYVRMDEDGAEQGGRGRKGKRGTGEEGDAALTGRSPFASTSV
jgi:hypothetical protein